jgi:hypothetical protein
VPSLVVERVVEERAELRAREPRRRVGEGLQETLEIELGDEHLTDLVDRHHLLERALGRGLRARPRQRLGLEGVRLLLQAHDGASAIVGGLRVRVALRRQHAHVPAADGLERRLVGSAIEGGHRVRAKEGERGRLRDLVPELLETNRGGVLSLGAE